MLANVALLTVTQQAYGKPAPNFLSVCLSTPPPSSSQVPHTQNNLTASNSSVLKEPVVSNTNSDEIDQTATSSLAYLSNNRDFVSFEVCVDRLAVEHCNSFYCPHSTILFYTTPFVFTILDLVLSKNELTGAVCKCVCLCVCAYISFDTVDRNMHDIFDVIAGLLVGVVSGKWFLDNLFSKLMARDIKVLDFTEYLKESETAREVEETDFTTTESFSVF